MLLSYAYVPTIGLFMKGFNVSILIIGTVIKSMNGLIVFFFILEWYGNGILLKRTAFADAVKRGLRQARQPC